MKNTYLYIGLSILTFIKGSCGDGSIGDSDCDLHGPAFVFHYGNKSNYGVDIRIYNEGKEQYLVLGLYKDYPDSTFKDTIEPKTKWRYRGGLEASTE